MRRGPSEEVRKLWEGGQTPYLRPVPTRPLAAIALPLADSLDALLRESCDLAFTSSAELPAAVGEAQGLLCSNMVLIDGDFMDAAPNLRVISGFGVGFDNTDIAAATERGILVCNTPGVLTDAVADLTMGLILSFSRRIIENAAYVRAGAWGATPPPPFGFDLRGKTLGIVGFGRIGLAVADRARAFGLEVIFHDLFREPPEDFGHCAYRGLDELLAGADIVSIHANLSPETHHLISEPELKLMKPTALIVNTARGPIIDQAALYRALTGGHIAGAALDVLEDEPPAAHDALLQLPNVIVLPHVGSATTETRGAMLDLAVRNLVEALSGREPPACVNPEALSRALRRRPVTSAS